MQDAVQLVGPHTPNAPTTGRFNESRLASEFAVVQTQGWARPALHFLNIKIPTLGTLWPLPTWAISANIQTAKDPI